MADLPKGYEFTEARIDLTPQWLSEYVSAVEDEAIAPQTVPPLSLAALSVRALLERASLPDGAIHVSQELSFAQPAGVGQTVVAKARVASRGERQGWVLMSFDIGVENGYGTPLMSGRATITFPARGDARGTAS